MYAVRRDRLSVAGTRTAVRVLPIETACSISQQLYEHAYNARLSLPIRIQFNLKGAEGDASLLRCQ